MAVVINPDGTATQIIPRDRSRGFTMEEIKKAIGGGWIELVRLAPLAAMMQITPDADKIIKQHPHAWIYLIIDEEGKLKNLPRNRVATMLYQQTHITTDTIVGPALMCVVTDKMNDDDMEVIL